MVTSNAVCQANTFGNVRCLKTVRLQQAYCIKPVVILSYVLPTCSAAAVCRATILPIANGLLEYRESLLAGGAAPPLSLQQRPDGQWVAQVWRYQRFWHRQLSTD